MKGLLRKEFYTVNKYCRSYFVIAIVFAVCSIWSESTFLMFYPLVLTGIIPVSLISYDERSRWEVYANVFPYTRKQMVTAKYLITALYVAATVLLLGVAGMIRNVVSLGQGGSGAAYFRMVGMMPLLGLLVPSIMLPPVFKLGAEKGRVFYYVMLVAVFALFGVVSMFFGESGLQGISISGGIVTLAGFLLAVVLFMASWALSVKLYEKREV